VPVGGVNHLKKEQSATNSGLEIHLVGLDGVRDYAF
jgi:hypothetical protein